jgi:hypothetical protein
MIFSSQDESCALRQGWFIEYGCAGSRIRALKPACNFPCDTAAVAYVAARAMRGDDLARNAILALVDEHNLSDLVRDGAPPVDSAKLNSFWREQEMKHVEL